MPEMQDLRTHDMGQCFGCILVGLDRWSIGGHDPLLTFKPVAGELKGSAVFRDGSNNLV